MSRCIVCERWCNAFLVDSGSDLDRGSMHVSNQSATIALDQINYLGDMGVNIRIEDIHPVILPVPSRLNSGGSPVSKGPSPRRIGTAAYATMSVMIVRRR